MTRARIAAALAQVEGKVGEHTDARVEGNIVEPEPVTVADDAELASMIAVPEGFEVTVAGRDLGHIRILAAHGENVYATRREEGDVIRLIDADGDGRFEDHAVAAVQPDLHGLWIEGDTAFLATIKEVYTAPILEDGSFGALSPIIEGLPDGGQHPNRTLAVGPDGLLYGSVGSTCNACEETSEKSATMLRAQADGSGRAVFASGLRNTIGFAFHPETGALWGLDHGIDWLGDDEQVEELNLIEEGRQYGWPYVYGMECWAPGAGPHAAGGQAAPSRTWAWAASTRRPTRSPGLARRAGSASASTGPASASSGHRRGCPGSRHQQGRQLARAGLGGAQGQPDALDRSQRFRQVPRFGSMSTV